MKFWFVLLALLPLSAARADALTDKFNTVWESLWFQGGAPAAVVRWPGDILVRVHGNNRSSHQDRIVKALTLVAAAAGRKVVDVSDAADAELRAQLEVHIVGERDLEDNQACYVRFEKTSDYLLEKAVLKMRTHNVYHCVLHEAMHAMGISGHPSGDTVLSYFYQRVDAITDLDRLMLKAWYSPSMKPGMTPFEALVVLTDQILLDSAGDFVGNRAAQQRFLQETMLGMESFAGDQGEIPVILKRSGKASGLFMRSGKTLIRYHLGLAYYRGTILPRDRAVAARWFERAARDGMAGAQYSAGYVHEKGEGVAVNALDAYMWYALAAAQGVTDGAKAVERLAATMSPEQIEQARAKISAFQPSL
jgi:TPR repeat protein